MVQKRRSPRPPTRSIKAGRTPGTGGSPTQGEKSQKWGGFVTNSRGPERSLTPVLGVERRKYGRLGYFNSWGGRSGDCNSRRSLGALGVGCSFYLTDSDGYRLDDGDVI